jgi:hypothetical protein
MDSGTGKLWPYSTKAALISIPLSWCILAIILYAIHPYWSVAGTSLSRIILLSFAIGLVPLLLLLVDYVAQSRAVIDIKGVKLDFSQTDTATRGVVLPDNVGRVEPLISDSSPNEIIEILESAIHNQVVRIDLKEGSAWWVSRLLALCAGASRVGSPKALVFVGLKENVGGAFLGWAAPQDLLRAMIEENQPRGNPPTTYGALYRKAVWITRQVALYGRTDDVPRVAWIQPDPNVPPVLSNEVLRYFQPHTTKYLKLGDAALEQILMDQLGLYQMETPADRLTLGRLESLFSQCLYRASVDLELPKDDQLTKFLDSSAPFVALVLGTKYQSLIERRETESTLLRQLFKKPKTKN